MGTVCILNEFLRSPCCEYLFAFESLSNRFDKALAKIKSWLSARRKSEPNAPRVLFLPGFMRQLEILEKSDRSMPQNFIKLLSADPDQPKRGRNVDGTRCHKTDLSKGNRAAMHRVLYYYRKVKNEVYFILLFAKADQSNLTDDQVKRVNYITNSIDKGEIDLISFDECGP